MLITGAMYDSLASPTQIHCLVQQGKQACSMLLHVNSVKQGQCCMCVQMAEAALADEWVLNGDRIALQRRVLRLGKPPRRWKRPPWAAVALREPLEVPSPLSLVIALDSLSILVIVGKWKCL